MIPQMLLLCISNARENGTGSFWLNEKSIHADRMSSRPKETRLVEFYHWAATKVRTPSQKWKKNSVKRNQEGLADTSCSYLHPVLAGSESCRKPWQEAQAACASGEKDPCSG